MTILAVFRSRTQSLDYAGELKRHGVNALVAPAPKEAKIGCGLCVKFDAALLPRARALLRVKRYSDFKGFYRLDYQGGRAVAVPVSK